MSEFGSCSESSPHVALVSDGIGDAYFLFVKERGLDLCIEILILEINVI